MKILHITLKDLAYALRSPFVLAFMLVLPLLQAGLPYLAFSAPSKGLGVQATHLRIVNLDQPVDEYPDFVAGNLLVETFRSPELTDLLVITTASDAATARQAVENRLADVALILPANFTASLFDTSQKAEIQLYHDPAASFGPAITREIVTNFTDGFTGSLLAADVSSAQLLAKGRALQQNARLEIMQRYGNWAQTVGESLSRGVHPAIRYQAAPVVSKSESIMKSVIGPLMLGMMVFFAFFVGAISAQSILRETEQGTLARLYCTATPRLAILLGKFGAVFGVLALQVALLLGLGALLFGIQWGAILAVLVNALGLVTAASGFSLLLISFLRSTRQAFLVTGGVVILTGMAGGTMTTTFSNLPAAYRLLTLFTPQGWILRGFEAAMRQASPPEIFLPPLVAVVIGLCCLAAGMFNLNRRYL